MRTRHSLLLLALAAFAGSAFAAAPQASTAKPEPAKTEAAKSAAAKPAHKDKRTCEQRGKTGHCEKWSSAKTDTQAAKPKR